MQVKVAEDYVASQEAAKGKDITMASGDWLAEDTLNEHFDLGYDYTCASWFQTKALVAHSWQLLVYRGLYQLVLCDTTKLAYMLCS